MKKCIDCGANKPLSEFYRHPQMTDGHLGSCKSCKCAYQEQRRRMKVATDPTWVAAEAERHRQKVRRRYHDVLKHDPDYWVRHADHRRASDARYPDKYRARMVFRNAVRDRKVVRVDHCSECGKVGPAHGHHADYSKPLDVEWLCPPCHFKRHRKHVEPAVARSPF